MKSKYLSGLAGFSLVLAMLNPLSAQAAPIDSSFGYDVSWPQCNTVLPLDGAFKVIGVNGGKPFGDNPCFEQQMIWAGAERAQLYINTANPGPELSSFWPLGQKTPRDCLASSPDTRGCAFNYGYNFAKYSHEFILRSYQNLGITYPKNQNYIWLDVETENSWRNSQAKNIAALKGAVYYFEKVAGITKLGFYSNSFQWGEITGSTLDFSAYPSWVATASNPQLSIEKCAEVKGFTGSRILLAQYIDPDLLLDVNVDCLNSPKLVSTLESLSPTTAGRGESVTLRVKLLSETGNPIVGKKVTFRFLGQNYKVTTNKNGVARKVVLSPSRKGDFKLKASFLGTRYFLESEQSSVIEVR